MATATPVSLVKTAPASTTPDVEILTDAEIKLLEHLGFSRDDIVRKAKQRKLEQQRATLATVLEPALTHLVDALPYTESAKSTWKGHSIDQVPFTHNGKTYSAKVIITDKG